MRCKKFLPCGMKILNHTGKTANKNLTSATLKESLDFVRVAICEASSTKDEVTLATEVGIERMTALAQAYGILIYKIVDRYQTHDAPHN